MSPPLSAPFPQALLTLFGSEHVIKPNNKIPSSHRSPGHILEP